MSKHDIDQILQAAFGDMDETERTNFTQSISGSADAEKELHQATSLKNALKSLGDVPECQLTNERLKHAILNQGAKPKKVAPVWSKWLAPAGLAAVAAYAAFIVLPSSLSKSAIAKNSAQPTSSRGSSMPIPQDASGRRLSRVPSPHSTDDSMIASSTHTRETVADAIDKAKERRLVAMNTPTEPAISLESVTSRPIRRSSISRAKKVAPAPIIDTDLLASKIANTAMKPVATLAAANALLRQESDLSDTAVSRTAPGANTLSTEPAKAISLDSKINNIVVIASEIDPETGAPLASEEQNHDIIFGG